MAKNMKPKEISKPRGAKSAAAHDDDEAVTGTMPSGDFIKKHITGLQALKSKSREVAGQIGAAVKNAENDENVHRGAAAWALKLAGMDPEKRDEHLRHFDSYRLQLGFGRQDDLFNDPNPAEAATFGGR